MPTPDASASGARAYSAAACEGKIVYTSRSGAQKALRAIQRTHTRRHAAHCYRCPVCRAWHLGHKREGE